MWAKALPPTLAIFLLDTVNISIVNTAIKKTIVTMDTPFVVLKGDTKVFCGVVGGVPLFAMITMGVGVEDGVKVGSTFVGKAVGIEVGTVFAFPATAEDVGMAWAILSP